MKYNNVVFGYSRHDDEEAFAELNAKIREQHDQSFLTLHDNTEAYGGSKVMTQGIATACFKYVHPSTILEYAREMTWQRPDEVAVFWSDEAEGYQWKMDSLIE